ncbi:uncharacterized protein LOC130371051 [Gadus chalcogrammus]|uniref:uncharacterized protein LOC130371051 n=1 Tax=Gadus chalcogrammus TaxID=1042646 RepID=UPI0024C4CE53|nr:uncharacterized protein LOC130371051 [Gadus chalcogrammus]
MSPLPGAFAGCSPQPGMEADGACKPGKVGKPGGQEEELPVAPLRRPGRFHRTGGAEAEDDTGSFRHGDYPFGQTMRVSRHGGDVMCQQADVLGAKHRVGRPTVEIPLEAIEGYLSHGLKVQEIADMYGVHRTSVHRKMQQNGLSVSDMYSEMSDTQLDALVLEIHRIHLCGYRMLRYHLQGRGHLVQIHRVRQSLKRVDPEGTEQRALANRTLHRRQYSVPGPNCMWHIDGNHKLIRWRFVIHGGIDGFSRLVVFLSAATNNRATTVLDAFLGAVRQYGVPSRVRSDKGRENFEVAYYMVDNCGPNRNSHITGRSVHNQRIERLWRDVYTQVLDLFHTLFHEMEASWMLNPDSEIHLFALHWVFLSLVQSHLRHFQDAWNFHSLRTENSQSPYQLWLRNISAVADPPEVGSAINMGPKLGYYNK